jgi:hypothetical protein
MFTKQEWLISISLSGSLFLFFLPLSLNAIRHFAQLGNLMRSRLLISSQAASKRIGREPIWVAAMGKLIASIMTPFKCLQFNEPFVIHTSADDAKNSENVEGSGALFPLVCYN